MILHPLAFVPESIGRKTAGLLTYFFSTAFPLERWLGVIEKRIEAYSSGHCYRFARYSLFVQFQEKLKTVSTKFEIFIEEKKEIRQRFEICIFC